LGDFQRVAQMPDLVRTRGNQIIAHYSLWQLQAPRQPINGRSP